MPPRRWHRIQPRTPCELQPVDIDFEDHQDAIRASQITLDFLFQPLKLALVSNLAMFLLALNALSLRLIFLFRLGLIQGLGSLDLVLLWGMKDLMPSLRLTQNSFQRSSVELEDGISAVRIGSACLQRPSQSAFLYSGTSQGICFFLVGLMSNST